LNFKWRCGDDAEGWKYGRILDANRTFDPSILSSPSILHQVQTNYSGTVALWRWIRPTFGKKSKNWIQQNACCAFFLEDGIGDAFF
jgi:hypothetical protein